MNTSFQKCFKDILDNAVSCHTVTGLKAIRATLRHLSQHCIVCVYVCVRFAYSDIKGLFSPGCSRTHRSAFFQTCCHFSQASALIFPVESSWSGRCEGRTALCRHIHHEPPITTESSLLSQSSCADPLWDFEACPSSSLHALFGCLSCFACLTVSHLCT